MSAGKFAKLSMGLVLAATGIYVFVYLWRWEWNRALLAAALFLAAEVALLASVVLERLARIERRLQDRPRQEPSPATVARIHDAAPPAREPFAWLKPDRFGVFVPILMGVGVVASGLAWVVERLARATAGPALERGLAGRLQALAWPERPLGEADEGTGSLLSGPGQPFLA